VRWGRSAGILLGLVGLVAAPLSVIALAGGSAAGASGPVAFTVLTDTSARPETCALGTVDLTSGATTTIGSLAAGSCVGDLAETSDGRVFGIQQQGSFPTLTVHLLQFNTTTGVATDLGQIGTFNASILVSDDFGGGITFDSDGNLFVSLVGGDAGCSDSAFCLYQVDPTNPSAATFVGTGTEMTDEQALTASCDGRAMTLAEGPTDGTSNANPFGDASSTTTTTSGAAGSANSSTTTSTSTPTVHAAFLGADPILNARSLSDGSMTAIGSGVGSGITLTGLVFDSSGTLWGIGFQGVGVSVFTVSTTTGVAAAGASTGLRLTPIGLALPLSCSVAPAAVVAVPAFTG
jgi:hypothetical protein